MKMKSYSHRTAVLVVLGVAAFAWSQEKPEPSKQPAPEQQSAQEKQATPSPAPQQQDSNAPPAALDSSDNPLTPGVNVRPSAAEPSRLAIPGPRDWRTTRNIPRNPIADSRAMAISATSDRLPVAVWAQRSPR